MASERVYAISYSYMNAASAPWYRRYWVIVPSDRTLSPRFRQIGYRHEGDRDEWDIPRAEAAAILKDGRADGSIRRVRSMGG